MIKTYYLYQQKVSHIDKKNIYINVITSNLSNKICEKVTSVNKSAGVLTIKPNLTIKVIGTSKTIENLDIKVSPS